MISRRYFFSNSMHGLAGASLAASGRSRAQAANNKVVLALIGAGGRGSSLAGNLALVENVEFKSICEVNDARGEEITRRLESIRGIRPKRVLDMRQAFEDKDVDGVVIATPEHWHALATVWACQAGKDVYVEKNISLTVWEGRKMVEAARKYKRIVQCGTQNRSAPYAATARDYIRNGALGRVVLVKVYNLLTSGGPWKAQQDGPVPPGVNWDLFLGPAREVPFNPGRLRGWGNYWDYAGGPLSGDGIHQLDLTRMALGDPRHPAATYCAGGRLAFDDARETPDNQVITYDYGSFVMTCESGNFTPYMKKFPPEVRVGTQWPNWPQSSCRVEIYGTKQMMYLGRHGAGWQVLEADGKLITQDKGYFPDKWHLPNFVDCIRSRKLPNADVEQGHYSACLVHLGNVALRAGKQRLEFDQPSERFVGNERANAFLKPAYRKHYRIPEAV